MFNFSLILVSLFMTQDNNWQLLHVNLQICDLLECQDTLYTKRVNFKHNFENK